MPSRGLAYPSHFMGFSTPVTAPFSKGWFLMLGLVLGVSSLCKGQGSPSILPLHSYLFPSWWFLTEVDEGIGAVTRV